MGETLAGRTLLVSGGGAGVGRAIATAGIRAGADVVVLVREATPELVAVRDRVTVVEGDVRVGADMDRAVADVIARFGRLDLLVNGAGARFLGGTAETVPEAFELMLGVNVLGTYLLTRAALPHLLESDRGHVLTISPPIAVGEDGPVGGVPYATSKLAATALTLGWSAEFATTALSANCLWPHAPLVGEDALVLPPRRTAAYDPRIMGDAAVEVFLREPGEVTGRTLLDAEVLLASGHEDLAAYERHPPRHLTGARPEAPG